MICIVTVLCVNVLHGDSVMRTYFLLRQCYAHMFCIVTALCVHVFYCDSVMPTRFVL